MSARDDGEVQVHVRDPWMSVAQRHITAASGLRLPWARLALAYLVDLGRRPGWQIYVVEVRRSLGMTDSSWRAARRELEQAGYYRAVRHHGADGRWHWTHHVYDSPQSAGVGDAPLAIRPIRRISTHGDATHGAATSGGVTDRCSTTSASTTARISTAAVHARPASAAAATAEEGGQTRHRRQVHGVSCWVADDLELVAELVAEHGAQAVQSMALRLRSDGRQPLPSAVEAGLLDARRRVREAEQAAARRAAAVPPPAVRTAATDDAAQAARAQLEALHLA